jgi:signal transduction histidine kinase/CheY-like chemotaxis protein/HPt (histidine-containing phosphotransfer) domain-containing protein
MKQAFSQDGWMQFEWMHCTLEGEEVPVEVTLSRFKQNGRYFLAAYTVDLRPLREADEKIRKLEHAREMDERINLLFDAAPIAIGMYDENLKMFNCNKETLRLFGFGEKAEFISAYNTRLFDFFPFIQPSGADTAGLYTAAFKGAREEGSYRIEGPVIAADGEKIPADITLLYIRHGHSSMYVVYLRDLRQAKAAEERKRLAEIAEESSRAKSRFLARMSHEIRTPISAVAGISEIQLQNSSLPPDTEEAFAKIHDSSNVLLGIINDILDLSRIDSGKMSLTSAEYEVASLINDTMQPYLIQSGKDILLNVHVDENIPRILIGDALRIKQILNNVMSNAFKYTESGAVTLLLQYEKKQNPTLIISVRDTGLGMTPEQVDALFKEYVRFHEQETYAEGAGLGMAIVQSLIYLMGAEIDVQSEVGTGTNVTLRIPQETGGDEVIGKEMADRLQLFGGNADTDAKKFKFTPEPMPYGRVLVVDDIDTNLYVARGLLSFYDLSIETCESGQAAIEKVRKGNVYDIVFMDHMMPGLNGTQTMHVMRDMGYTAPIIALTANAIIGQAEEFMKNGFDDFISKPIQTATLNAVLIKYVRDKHPIAVVEAAKAAAATAPVRQTDIDKYQSSAELTNKLRTDFARRHKHTCMDINKALASGDTETAHIAAHSLKGSAGLIAENTLADAARDIENALRAGQRPTDEQMATLSAELGCVLARLGKPQPTIAPTNDLDKDKALALLDTLTPLLKSQNAKCLSYLDELKTMPETAILVRQIEEFDFRTATKSLETLRTIWDEW